MGDVTIPLWTYYQKSRGGIHGEMRIENEDKRLISIEKLFEIGKSFSVKTTSERILCPPPIKLFKTELKAIIFSDKSSLFVQKEKCLFVRLYDGLNTDWVKISDIKMNSWILTDKGEVFNNNGNVGCSWDTPILDGKSKWKQIVCLKTAGMCNCYQIMVPDLGHCFVEGICLRD